MKKWIIAGLVAIVLGAVGFTNQWWLPKLFPFLKTYKDEIDTAMKILVPMGSVAAFFITLWLEHRKKSARSNGGNITQAAQAGGDVVQSAANSQIGGVHITAHTVSIAGGVGGKDKDAEHAGHDIIHAEGPVQTGGVTAARNVQTGGVSVASQGPLTIQGDVVHTKTEIHQHEPSSAPLPPPHQLPPPPGDFQGREEELASLRAAMAAGKAIISGLQGQGGIGKTVLALKLAAELTRSYPDAQIYLDLKGVSDKPLSPSEALAYVIRSFHPDVRLPENQADLEAQYRSVLHGKRVLLLMDNGA